MHVKCLPLSVLLLAAVGFTACDGGGTDRVLGEIAIVSEHDGATLTDRDAHFDFGPVFDSQSAELPIAIKNVGRGPLSLAALEVTSGTPEVFEIEFQPTTIGVSDFVELEATFSPPEAEAAVDYELVLTLRAENTRTGEETATITLTGRGVPGVCKLPEKIDFGTVAVDDLYAQGFTIPNPTQLPAEATVGEVTSSSGDHAAFTFTSDSLTGVTTLDPQSSGEVRIEFRPTQTKSYLAFMKARASAQCPEQMITLVGTGVQSVLSWTPAKLDCGYATPGAEVVRDLTLTNLGNADAHLTEIGFLKSKQAEFHVVPDDGADPSTLTVPGKGGTATLSVACAPAVLGPRSAVLGFKTDLARQPTGDVQVVVFGGGPDVNVVPAPNLNFGKVAWFAPPSPQVFQKKKVTVMNVGTTPPAQDVNANLHLVNHDGGFDREIEWIDVVPLNAETEENEFTVEVPDSYDNATGLLAKVGENQVELIVTLTPTSLGQKQAELRIHTNDPDEPVVTLIASAEAVDLPPCNYTVTPSLLNFGLIPPPTHRDLGFSIRNNGIDEHDVCLISNLDLGPGTDPIFSLPSGGIDGQYELPAGESLEILVRAWPQGQTPSGVSTVTGSVDFYVSSPIKPEVSVTLTAQIAASCLTIAPNDLDFGTVQLGCSSQTRSFQIYNSCSGTVRLFDVFMQVGAGQGSGGPNCPGGAPCPEFLITQAAPIPAGGMDLDQGDLPVTFQAKYRPIDTGADTGAIAITALQGGVNVTYVVALHGRGDPLGIQTDVFTQDAKPKADILLVIDDSGSMSTYQDELADNFSSFIKYAESAQVDYHLAVVRTEASPALGGANSNYGKFEVGPDHPDKVLTPTSPNVKDQFAAKVNVGTSGFAEMDADPALIALTPPLINSDNAGFLREDAALAVVAVTDANDQSPQSTSYYLNGFWGIKGFGHKGLFSFNAIAGFSPSCLSSVESGDSGELALYVSQTNGVKDDICTTDWSETLEKLSATAFGFRTLFFMTSVPDLSQGPVEVRVDGALVDATDDRGGVVWTYDPIQNGINFEPLFVPEPGQTLTITYPTTCYP